MARPKLNVTHVWILEEVIPYDGSITVGVFVDVELAKEGRKGWKLLDDGDWSTAPDKPGYESFFVLTKHQIRTK